MKTVLLCGGFGTRIRDVADDIPKPLIKVGEMPIDASTFKTRVTKYPRIQGSNQSQ